MDLSNPEEPDKKPKPPAEAADPGATVAWDPDDVFEAKDETPPAPDSVDTLPLDFHEAAAAIRAEAEEVLQDLDDPLVGQLLRDKWRVLKRIGAGSFGSVYKVEDVAGGWVDALKILGVDKLVGAEAENMRKRFLREAQIMKRLGKESKHIVGLSTYEEDIESGLIYFLMEYVEGKHLADVVAEEGPFSVERTIKVALQVCDALIAAHEGAEPVVHRDLKLENLMLTIDHNGEEVVKVLDFGIAKIAEKEADSRLTAVGTLGTPGYAAPEQLRAEEVDGRTDLFAFGVILYSLLTGKDPWLGNLAHVPTTQIYELMVATERGQVRPMDDAADIPPAMRNVVLKLLRRDPGGRFRTASELKDALERVAAGLSAVDVGSLRVLTDEPGVEIEIRSGRRTVAQGPTPLVANAIDAGTYRVLVRDPGYEPLETSIEIASGAIEDLTLVVAPLATGFGATLRRHGTSIATAIVVIAVGGAAAFLQPWGRTLELTDLQARAQDGSVTHVWLAAVGIEGQMSLGAVPLPFEVSVTEDGIPDAVESLRAAGVDVDTSFEVQRLIGLGTAALARMEYFGNNGDDVRGYAERATALDPESAEARSLLLKVAERMAWDADAARADGSPDTAERLLRECLTLVPDHPRCLDGG